MEATGHVPQERGTVLALLVVVSTLGGVALFHHVGWGPGVAAALFTLLFGHLVCSFLVAVGGFARRLRSSGWKLAALPAGSGGRSRTAVVMVIRHEEPARVAAGVRVMLESLAASGSLEGYTFFVLSDSTDPAAAHGEEQAMGRLAQELGPTAPLVYRRRLTNEGRKSGNLADFCARWGLTYDYMVVLDADSLLDGRTIRELVRRMDAGPRLGILQAPARPVRRESLFGRIQQFAASVHGPMVAEGLDFWLGGAAPYWGHNAIIRVEPFMRHCRLPRLSGRGPLSGDILSHDFVEGALMRRAGWEVRLAADLRGSYEELPADLIAYAARDRRWCQGNLQHLRLVFTPGLCAASRLTLAVGALAYLTAPAWAAFLVAISASRIGAAEEMAATASGGGHRLASLVLTTTVLVLLFLPKVLAVVRLALRPGGLRAFGGLRAVLLSMGGESLFAVLLAPVLLVLHTQFVLAILARRAVDWGAQRRRDVDISLGDALGAHGAHTAVGLAGGLAVYAVDPSLCLWLGPIMAGLGLSIPLAMLTSRARLGRQARRWGLFLIPEEIAPPRVLRMLAARAGPERRPARARAWLEAA